MKKCFAVLGLSFVPMSVFADELSKYETIPENEDLIIQAIIENTTASITNKRDAHPKDHGCVDDVKITVLKSEDSALQKGLFATPGKEYSGMMRFSAATSNPYTSDLDAGGQGLALKILLPEADQFRVKDIEGEKFFSDKKYYKSFDILTVNGLHEFMVETVADYPAFSLAASEAGKAAQAAAEAGKTPAEIGAASFKALDDYYFHLSGQEGKKRPLEAQLMGTFSSLKTYDLTDTSYQSWVPSLLDDLAVKYQIRPCSDHSTNNAEIFDKLGIHKDDPNFLRAVLKYQLQNSETCFVLAVQKHLEGFPDIENATAPWPLTESPYEAIALITVPQKNANVEFMPQEFCEVVSFNAGHSTPEHRPIGGIQRLRKLIYAVIETKRNGG